MRAVWYNSQKLRMAATRFAKSRLAPAGFLSQYGYGLCLCALVLRGQTCWRLVLAGAGVLHLGTTWPEPFYVLVSEAFGSEKQHPQSWFICAYEMLSPGKRNLEPPSLVPNKCPEYTLDYLMHVLMQ